MRTLTIPLPVKTAPEYISRRIVWNKEGTAGEAVLLVGYCPTTLPYYLGMVEELLKTFPDADLQKVIFGHVTQSPSVKGHTLLIAPVNGPRREIAQYDEWQSIDFNY